MWLGLCCVLPCVGVFSCPGNGRYARGGERANSCALPRWGGERRGRRAKFFQRGWVAYETVGFGAASGWSTRGVVSGFGLCPLWGCFPVVGWRDTTLRVVEFSCAVSWRRWLGLMVAVRTPRVRGGVVVGLTLTYGERPAPVPQ